MKYHMRRNDKEITDPSEMKKLLEKVKFVTIAMAKDNMPYLVTSTSTAMQRVRSWTLLG
jgi:nitroimidazol reductase NimA-like FMN-containing flavoprotein (pyridoxamine 5'-phosphate oxidase superfamily)